MIYQFLSSAPQGDPAEDSRERRRRRTNQRVEPPRTRTGQGNPQAGNLSVTRPSARTSLALTVALLSSSVSSNRSDSVSAWEIEEATDLD
jgi:hypothetical protein